MPTTTTSIIQYLMNMGSVRQIYVCACNLRMLFSPIIKKLLSTTKHKPRIVICVLFVYTTHKYCSFRQWDSLYRLLVVSACLLLSRFSKSIIVNDSSIEGKCCHTQITKAVVRLTTRLSGTFFCELSNTRVCRIEKLVIHSNFPVNKNWNRFESSEMFVGRTLESTFCVLSPSPSHSWSSEY